MSNTSTTAAITGSARLARPGAVRPNPRPAPRPARPAPVGPRWPSPAPGTARRLLAAFGVAVVALAALAAGFGVGQASANLDGPAPAPSVYVVQPGDTLWAIAAKVAPSADAERAVGALRDSAGTAQLVPGQRIEIPARLR